MAGRVQKIEQEGHLGAFLVQTLIALLVLGGGLYGGYYYAPDGIIPVPSTGEFWVKMAYTLRCFLFLAFFLGFIVLLTGQQRVKVGATNPLSGNEGGMLLHKKRLQNSLEHTFIFIMISLLLTTLFHREEMIFIFLSTIVFLVGRILFWVGYGIHPYYRQAGIFITLGLTYLHLYISTYLLFSRLLTLGTSMSTVAAIAAPSVYALGQFI